MTKKRVLSVVLALAMLGMTACGNAEKSEAVETLYRAGQQNPYLKEMMGR